MGLLRLSTEILIEILLYLDVSDAYAIQSVNHFLNHIYQASLELQYALECKVANVLDNPHCHLPVGDRLRMLRDREAAWTSMKPTLKRTISPLPEFDLFSYLRPVIQQGHYLLHDSFTTKSTIKSLLLHECHENAFRSFEMNDLKLISCCIEEHDLIACLTCPRVSDDLVQAQIEFIQHSTGVAHPLAANPTIILGTTAARTMRGKDCVMQVFGENLALIIVLEHKVWLYVFEWMTGIVKFKSVHVPNPTGITVLSGDLILIPDFDTFSLHIYHIPPSSRGGAVKLICHLRLPDWARSGASRGMKCHGAPNPTGDGNFPKHVSSSVPFIDDPTTALIQIMWRLWKHNPDAPRTVSLLVHRHSIMNTLPPSSSWSTITSPVIIDWETWGPSVTDQSIIPGSLFSKSNYIVHGQRHLSTIYHFNDVGEALPGDTVLKDFNKYRARRALFKNKNHNNSNHDLLQSKETLPFCESSLPIQSKRLDYSITNGLIIGFAKTELPDDDFTYSLEIMHFGHQG